MKRKPINQRAMRLDDHHSAKKFLKAFIACRTNCVGRHHDWTGQIPIEQEWRSATDGRVWTFSGFVYAFLSLDIQLDGFLERAAGDEAAATFASRPVPVLQSMMEECAAAAERDGNRAVLELTDQVLQMLALWEQFLAARSN